VQANDEDSATGVVLPVDPGRRPAGQDDPWRLLVEGDGLLVTWSRAPERTLDTWGGVLRGTSALSSELSTILSRASASAAQSGTTLFRLELPTGSTIRDLVPAVGGGFRGLVRDGGSGISGHVRLIAVGGGGTAAGVALGPLLALMAVTVGAEMLARHQQDKKLTQIREGIAALRRIDDETMDAQLDSVEEALALSSAALVDRVSIPSGIGLGPAVDNLRMVKKRGLSWLSRWETGAAKEIPGSGGVAVEKMQSLLAGDDPREDFRRFPQQVARLHRALTLDSRGLVVTGAEAALRNPDESLAHLQDSLSVRLRQNAETQQRLQHLLWRLAEPPITYRLPWQSKDAMALDRELATLAANVSRLPDAPSLLTPGNRQVLEVLRRPDGTTHVLSPGTAD
jgi:hypothetical protein